jgi:predicted  nucleic acid-binding Zn-ribbon protein
MFDEAKVRKDIQRMREAYEKAQKSLADIEERQKQIAEKIYAARKNNSANNNKILWE